jgi:hypothetical protein
MASCAMEDHPLSDSANKADELTTEMMRMSASEFSSSRGLFVRLISVGKARTAFSAWLPAAPGFGTDGSTLEDGRRERYW